MSGFDTVYPADSVEFCPQEGSRHVFVCGTYKLEQSKQQGEASDPDIPWEPLKQCRRGNCLVFGVSSTHPSKLEQLQRISLPAVLDMKWCHRSGPAALGIADSEGNVSFHEWQADQNRLTHLQTVSCALSDVLCLSLDWSDRRYHAHDLGNLVVSLSDGSISVLRPDSHRGMVITDSWPAHDYEPWIAAWNYWDTNVIFSGGDDLKMKGWDCRQGSGHPIFINKQFNAGVTTIQSHPFVEHAVAVGSYDDTVRLFDMRKPLVPVLEADVGGGAWRVKWHPHASRKEDLLVACMHDGFKILKMDVSLGNSSEIRWEVAKRFDAHTSLAYGVDWSFEDVDDVDDTLIGSCSFYDHMLHLWRG
ncbi:WD40-repeat-containing domain protein [Hygrophoropsis aurantiaca]|uniref:WD40-repeat-containing domain protein n=1 Tax=Hygrophoropsis aurantiaca TaxID=72124 RepID=A0ACB8AD58_9AGAM|nr:WD40-repeat-containing domain protein [Hygrophoropsis aurantiaca]